MRVPCSCDVKRRYALGFAEDASAQAMSSGARQVTRPNRALHTVHRYVNLRPLAQHIRSLGKSVNTTEERAIRDEATAAEHRLLNRTHASPKTVDLSRGATERGAENIAEDWRARPLNNHKCRHRAGSMSHMGYSKRFTFSGRLAHPRCAMKSATDLGWSLEEGLGRPIGECSTSCKYC